MAAPAPSFTAAQAERGAEVFTRSCALCHGDDMGGGTGAPPLIGPEFTYLWNAKPAAGLFDAMRAKMPPGQAGSLSDEEYLDLLAAILKRNGQAPGDVELTAGSAAMAAPLPLRP